MKTTFFFILAFAVAVASCKKDNDDDGDNGNTAESYQPTSAGSMWQYNSSLQGSYTEVATGGDTTIGGQKYFAFDNSANGRRYVNNNNGIYTSYGRVPLIDTTISLQYLRDAPATTSWTNTSVYSGIPITLTSTITSRDGEETVNGTAFSNVIAVDYNITAPNPLGGTLTIATGQQFYAKGVGVITSTIHLNTGTQIMNDSTYLVSYDIK